MPTTLKAALACLALFGALTFFVLHYGPRAAVHVDRLALWVSAHPSPISGETVVYTALFALLITGLLVRIRNGG